VIFEWDEMKNAANRRKHGVSFETATVVFDDPHQLLIFDRVVDGEERWQTIGLVDGVLLMLVVHTMEEEDGKELFRFISARKAEPHEKRLYDDAL
jgi:uncharacterized DUF497 family protein